MRYKIFKLAFLFILPLQLLAQLPNFSFFTPELAGTLRLGLINGESSMWLSDCSSLKVKTDKQETTYAIEHQWLGKGTIKISTHNLLDTPGMAFKVVANNIPETIQLFWAFGGSLGEIIPEQKGGNLLKPEYCKDNVFSVEGHAFTVYYGNSRRLRIYEVITPLESNIRLSDAHQQSTPLQLFNSGKKTDAPVLSATTPIKNEEAIYFCFYKQNPKADYNHYMLPKLYEMGSYEFHKETEWMQSTPD